MSRQIHILCGVPKEHCSGSKLVTDQGFTTDKCHPTHGEAFLCMTRYLVQTLGYTRLKGNEFKPPGSGAVRILTRPSRYGGLLVTGKEQQRFMPEKRAVGNRGTISG